MIIKCPKCKNNFLAPDDLQENQTLQCGFCKNLWLLKQEMKKIPEALKPAKKEVSVKKVTKKANKKIVKEKITTFQKFNYIFKKFVQNAIIAVIIVTVLINSRHGIVKLWEPSAVFFDALGFPVSVKGETLRFKNIKINQTNMDLILIGQIVNDARYTVEIPDLKINPNFKISLVKEYLKPNEVLTFQIKLPPKIKTPVEISF